MKIFLYFKKHIQAEMINCASTWPGVAINLSTPSQPTRHMHHSGGQAACM